MDLTDLSNVYPPTNRRAISQRPLASIRQALVAGTLGSLTSTLALLLAGRRETGSYTAPTNATSHWVWDRSAFAIYSPTMRHTAVGYGIHHSMSLFWALIHAWTWGRMQRPLSWSETLACAGLTAASACLVDYTVTPKRLTPGFEQHLSKRAMAGVYVAFGLGLAAGCLLVERQRR